MRLFFYSIGLCIITAILSGSASFAGNPAGAVQEIRLTGPLGFIENKGQFLGEDQQPRTDLLFLFKRPGMKVQLMKNRISYEMYTMTAMNNFSESHGAPDFYDLDPEDYPYPDFRYNSSRIDVEFIGANADPEIVTEEMMPDYINYYLAYTPVEGITRVKQYNKITYRNLYPNIDLVMISMPELNPHRALAYDFVVHPGGNVSDIRYRYHGADDQVLYENGMLETSTPLGTIEEFIPESYLLSDQGQKLNPVNVSFYFNKDVISFKSEKYDATHSLVIDPYLVWATYCGGDTSEEGRGIATDSFGHVAIIGATGSTNNIATDGAYQTELIGIGDIFLEKYDSLGARIWGTYYGGSSRDQIRGVVTNPEGDFYLGCHTDSPDGMATPDAWKPNYTGGVGDDAVLAHFDADGFRIWATYYGGADEEIIRRLDIDKSHNIVMVGYTHSDTGIATPGVAQTTLGGDADVCISKWSPDGQLIWGSYFGGEAEEHGRSVDTDNDGNIYINGSTASDNLGTPGVSRQYRADKQDFMVLKFTADGQLAWMSYWGGKYEDRGRGVFVDSSNTYVYHIGYTASDTGIATPGAYQDYYNFNYGPNGLFHDIVAMKWTLDGQIVWGTYLGGTNDDRGRSVTMIGDRLFVSGSTESPDTMATPNALQPAWGGQGDMFLEYFDVENGYRLYGTYYGGNKDDDNLALAVDYKKQNIYLIGTSRSDNVATPDVAQPTRGGLDDALLVKIHVSDLFTGAETVNQEDDITVFPNPAYDHFTVTFANATGKRAEVELRNLLGQVVKTVYSGKTTERFSVGVDAGDLPSGIYYVKVTMGNQAVSRKLVIEK